MPIAALSSTCASIGASRAKSSNPPEKSKKLALSVLDPPVSRKFTTSLALVMSPDTATFRISTTSSKRDRSKPVVEPVIWLLPPCPKRVL